MDSLDKIVMQHGKMHPIRVKKMIEDSFEDSTNMGFYLTSLEFGYVPSEENRHYQKYISGRDEWNAADDLTKKVPKLPEKKTEEKISPYAQKSVFTPTIFDYELFVTLERSKNIQAPRNVFQETEAKRQILLASGLKYVNGLGNSKVRVQDATPERIGNVYISYKAGAERRAIYNRRSS